MFIWLAADYTKAPADFYLKWAKMCRLLHLYDVLVKIPAGLVAFQADIELIWDSLIQF